MVKKDKQVARKVDKKNPVKVVKKVVTRDAVPTDTKVVVTKDITIKVGGKSYKFLAGKSQKVPSGVYDALERMNLLVR